MNFEAKLFVRQPRECVCVCVFYLRIYDYVYILYLVSSDKLMGYVSCCFGTYNFIKKFTIKDASRQTNKLYVAYVFVN